MIPKIIHQIYFDLGIGNIENNKVFFESHNKFKSLKDYKYILWNKKDCENLVKSDFNEYFDFYNNFRFEIQKIDFIRFCILYKYGGIYVDLDFLPLKNFDDLLVSDIVFHNIRYIKPNYSYIENDFMGSKSNLTFWKKLMNYCYTEYNDKKNIKIYDIWKGRFILQTTGPKLISRFVKNNYNHIKPITITFTKWNKDNETEYFFKDFKLNTWVKNN